MLIRWVPAQDLRHKSLLGLILCANEMCLQHSAIYILALPTVTLWEHPRDMRMLYCVACPEVHGNMSRSSWMVARFIERGKKQPKKKEKQ